jgi:CRP-like cAMP-binding protein
VNSRKDFVKSRAKVSPTAWPFYCRDCANRSEARVDGTELRMRRQELAQMTGTTLCTVSRILSRWADLGLVIRKRDGITVRDPDHLAPNPWEGSTPLCRHA